MNNNNSKIERFLLACLLSIGGYLAVDAFLDLCKWWGDEGFFPLPIPLIWLEKGLPDDYRLIGYLGLAYLIGMFFLIIVAGVKRIEPPDKNG